MATGFETHSTETLLSIAQGLTQSLTTTTTMLEEGKRSSRGFQPEEATWFAQGLLTNIQTVLSERGVTL